VGAVVDSAHNDAFGRLLEKTIPAAITTRLYTGSIYDPATGLYKIGARWYDPVTALWLTPDSIVPDVNNPSAWNPYAFNYQNPVNYVDPSGHFPWLAVGLGFAAGGAYSWLRGYGPDTWQFYAAGVSAAGVAGLGFATGGYLAFGLDVGGGTLADALIFGDAPGGALVSNLAGNVAFLGIGKVLRHLPFVRAFREGGILPWHARGFAAYADETGQVVAVRATNRRAGIWNVSGAMGAKPEGFSAPKSPWGIYRSGHWRVHSDYDLAAIIKNGDLVAC
jgi:RHS repeat-associated protein